LSDSVASTPSGGSKAASLLAFLKASASMRRKRVASYGSSDKVLWFADVPKDRRECRSQFLGSAPEDPSAWLEVRKKPIPKRPAVPAITEDWVRPDQLDDPANEPKLSPEITVLVKHRVPDPNAPEGSGRTIEETVPEVRKLSDHRAVEDAWLEYLVNEWEPWAKEMRAWQEVQHVYETLDFMRRRLEEAEERYELILAIGFLEWRDPTETSVARHVLTAPAEVTLDATRGLLTVAPGISFESLRVEMDMLELQHRPRLEASAVREKLESIDIQAWDLTLVGPVLQEIANTLRSDSQVSDSLARVGRAGERPQVSFAPALVLRERRPTAYDELIGKFHEAAEKGSLDSTGPWDRIIEEGQGPSSGSIDPNAAPDDDAPPAPIKQFLFPKPSNDEQRQIVDRLAKQPCVLVKGPPGTGKSHTIANLISHLLAHGERVLVTAQAPKALAVLRELLPDEIQHLCVTALGGSREEQEMLKAGIGSILARRNQWKGPRSAQRDIEKAETALRDLQGEFARIEGDLRQFREAETHTHDLPGGYSGTAARIAKELNARAAEFQWFPMLPRDAAFPLEPTDVQALADAHDFFTPDVCAEVGMDVGSLEILRPEDFQALVATLDAARVAMERASRGIDAAKFAAVDAWSLDQQRGLRDALRVLTERALRAQRVLGGSTETILQDLLAAAGARWTRLASESESILKEAERLMAAIGSAHIELSSGDPEERVRADVARRLAHFEGGGRRGFSVFAPGVVRETRYISEKCRVDGRAATELDQLRKLRDHLDLRRRLRELAEVWGSMLPSAGTPKQTVTLAEELTHELKSLLEFFASKQATALATFPGSHRTGLAGTDARAAWLSTVEAVLATRETRDAEAALARVLDAVRAAPTTRLAHSCMRALEDAVRARDAAAWRAAWQQREGVRSNKARLAARDALLGRLEASCPGVARLIQNMSGDPAWRVRVCELRAAWEWASARAWLNRISDAASYKARVKDYHRVQGKIEAATEKLVELRAWKAFFERLDDRTVQNLNAWVRANQQIGQGTGVQAYRHRATARRYLTECLPRIPAWVMPLHKLWDSVTPTSGLFDTVIVDEASQAGCDALALMLLAKRIIVVGDDKQNSPEGDFISSADIANLQRIHLSEFHFREEFRPDVSLFSHAKRLDTSPLALQEHYRCMPEIIRFSNDLCYTDAPLIPLRQAPPDRLPPIRSQFVPNGVCDGREQNIQNHAEAQAIVDTIAKLAEDPAYDGKTMGVIALQGHAQARLIEKLLVKSIEPSRFQRLRLRCGEASTFQGDERHVMFLSLVTAPNVNRTSLTDARYERSYNVAMSRARDQVWLFHSVPLQDLGHNDLRHRLLRFFETPHAAELDAVYEQLDKLESLAKVRRQLGTQPQPYDSWFEVDVALELMRRKYRMRPQVETAGRRIDLVVEGLDTRIAVECDGDFWHGPEQFDDDMRRQRQLERAGWTFVRVRESEFYANPERAMGEVFDACAEYGIRPVDGYSQANPAETEQTTQAAADGDADDSDAIAENEASEAPDRVNVPEPSTGPFTGYSKESGFPDPRDATAAKVRKVLREIIERDGPLTRQSIYSLYVKGCPEVERVVKSVRAAIDKALRSMRRTEDIVQDDELGDASPESQVIRLAEQPNVRVRPAGARNLLEIPPSELIAVLRQDPQLRLSVRKPDEETFRMLLGHYGFSSLTKMRRQYLTRVVKLARKIGNGSTPQ
jgi:very-short-patch-repair endonuclease